MVPHLPDVDALVFDVFGTLVDWRGSLIDDLAAFGAQRGITADWSAFVDAWRGAYWPAMDGVRSGAQPWTPLDALHAASFDELARSFGFGERLDDAARRWCVDRWHRLRPWPDTVAGLTRLRARYIVGSLSNGNIRLLVDLAKDARLPFDVLFSAETFAHYKPDPQTYLGAATLLALPPERVMLVAAHNDDLDAARALGLRTAFVARPAEYGPAQTKDLEPGPAVDVFAADLNLLAERLGA